MLISLVFYRASVESIPALIVRTICSLDKMLRQTALVVGSSGNIGVAIIVAALRTNFNVLAVVRNDASKNKIIQHLAFDKNLNKDDITFVEADVLSDDGVAQVVDKVKAGSLPDFQHVFSGGGSILPRPCVESVYNEGTDRHLQWAFGIHRRRFTRSTQQRFGP